LGVGLGLRDGGSDGDDDRFSYTSVGPGLSWFVTPSVAVEASLQWERLEWSDDSFGDRESTKFLIGFSTFL